MPHLRALLLVLPAVLVACPAPADSADPEHSGATDTSDDTGSDTSADTDTGSDTDTGADTDTGSDTADTADTGSDTADTADTGSETGDSADTGSDTADTADTADTDPPCRVRFLDSTPADGAVDVYYRDNLSFELSRPDPTAWVDASFAGTSSVADEIVTYELTAPLSPSTSYTATLNYCAGTETISFTTSAFGTPLVDPVDLEGRTWALDLAGATWVEPGTLGSLLSSSIERYVLLGVTGADTSTLDLRFGLSPDLSTPATQDPDADTFDLAGGDFTGQPYFTLTAATATLETSGVTLEVSDLVAEGTFAADGSSIGGLAFQGLVDTRPLVPLVDPTGGDDAICSLTMALGEPCEACPDGTSYCLPLALEDIPAPEVVGVELTEVTGGTASVCSAVSAALPLGVVGLLLVSRRVRKTPKA